MKQIIKTFLVVMLSFTLVGCGNDSSGGSSSSGSSSTGIEVVDLYGESTISSDDTTTYVYEGMSINVGDSITVGSDAYLQLEVNGSDILYVGETSIITINTIDSGVSINLSNGYLVAEVSSNDEYAIETVNSMITTSGTLFGVFSYDGGYTGMSRAYCYAGEVAMIATDEASDAYQEYSCEAGYTFEISGLGEYATFVSSSTDDTEYKEMELRSQEAEMVRLLAIQSDVGSIEGCYTSDEISEEAITQGVDFTTYTLTTVVDGVETTYTYLAGSKFNLEDPEVDGTTFDGWYQDEEYTVYNYSSYLNEDLCIYAKLIQE
ncbi:InlB B-repeat-containing protein [Tannockella kyphosi]|uniref:InlB B-repeat-containing protein n=1 Tax=Tannockella kyphosi TaxID=2899121 RepID=UPI0020118F99|nr:InlB B-repeat-containing protein [Tannockella kyphosi]